VDVSIARGEVVRARELLDEVAPVVPGLRPHGGAAAEYFLASAIVAAAVGDWSNAQSAFDAAIDVNRTFSLPWDEAYVHYRWSLALLTDSAAPSDQDSVWHLRHATRLWDAMGAGQYAARCEHRYLTIQHGGPGGSSKGVRSDPPGDQSLTSKTQAIERGRKRATLAEARKGSDLG
jgi:hypothetical protein